MDEYNPVNAPDAIEWLALDEDERIELVRDYHHRARVKLPNARLHTAIHVIVENQAAMGDELPVRRTDERLQTEGLDRHEAIHAVGSVLAAHIHEILNTGSPNADANALYWAALETLTAEGWRCGP